MNPLTKLEGQIVWAFSNYEKNLDDVELDTDLGRRCVDFWSKLIIYFARDLGLDVNELNDQIKARLKKRMSE